MQRYDWVHECSFQLWDDPHLMNVGWIDASKVVSKSIWRCVMHIHKFCVDVRCARILGSYSWWMPLEHLMWWSQIFSVLQTCHQHTRCCFPAYSIVSLSFSLRFRSVNCLHHMWATKILPLSLNGVPDHILQFGCRRQMEDFHTVCRSKLWQTAILSCGMVYTTQGAGLQEGAFKSAFILCAFPNTACFLLQKPCMAVKGNLYKQS